MLKIVPEFPFCVKECRTSKDYNFLFAAISYLPFLQAYTQEPVMAAGGSFNRKKAHFSCYGEAMERYSLFCVDLSRIVRRKECEFSSSDLFVSPAKFLFYIDEVYNLLPLRRYNLNESIFWIKGVTLKRNNDIWLPIFAVYNASDLFKQYLANYDLPLSTGGSCDNSYSKAVEKGLLEVIERDAFMIHWEAQWPGKEILDLEEIMPEIFLITQSGFSVKAFILENDFHIPVVLAIIYDERQKRAAYSVGAAAARNFKAASIKAVEEAILANFWVTCMLRRNQISLKQIMLNINTLPSPAHHAHMYGFYETGKNLDFLWNSLEKVKVNWNGEKDVFSNLDEFVGIIDKQGYEPLVVDVTVPEIRKQGFHVVKALIPGLVTLSRGVILRPLNNKRLREVPGIFNFDFKNFNNNPHPFP